MKKTLVRLFIVVLSFFLLAACAGNKYAGKYILVSVEDEGEVLTGDELKLIFQAGSKEEAYILLKKDNTYKVSLVGITVIGTYEVSDNQLILHQSEGGDFIAFIQDDQIIVNSDETIFTYMKQ